MIVYLVRNTINEKGYVGYTKRGLQTRWHEHVSNARRGKKEMPIYSAIRKYGAEAFELSVLQECSSVQEMKDVEPCWIKDLKTFIGDGNGYNATRGGDGVTGWSPTPEHRQKIREGNLGEKNHSYGGLSDEHKRSISLGRKGKGLGNKSALGYHHTEDAKVKISVAQYVPVAQYDMDGNLIATYGSMIEASKALGFKSAKGISRACRFPHRMCGGYRWKYAVSKDGE